jgi:DNA-binding transcriptional ArsR family regulator
MLSEAQGTVIDDVARALSDGTRRSILRLVRDEERSAGDLAGQFRTMSRPAVSQHLRVLHDAGLVTVRSDGSRRMYRARTEGLADMWQYLDEMWTDRLGRLKVAAERAEWSERRRHQLDTIGTRDRPRAPTAAPNRAKPALPTRRPGD